MKSRGTKNRRSTDPAKKQLYFEHIKRWLESNISQKEYCKEHGIKLTSLMYWRKKYLEASKVEPIKNNAFTQIKIKEETKPVLMTKKYSSALLSGTLAVILPNGIELILPAETENQRITALLQSLWGALC